MESLIFLHFCTFSDNPMGFGSSVNPPKTSPSQFVGGFMSRLFPEPLNERVFQPFLHDFLNRGAGGGPPSQIPTTTTQYNVMSDLPQELDTLAITLKVKEKLAANNLGQKVSLKKGL